MPRLLVFIVLSTVINFSYAWSLFGPANYDECILENIKGVSDDFGVKVITRACSNKFFHENENPDWNECIFENMKGVSNKLQAMVITNSCWQDD